MNKELACYPFFVLGYKIEVCVESGRIKESLDYYNNLVLEEYNKYLRAHEKAKKLLSNPGFLAKAEKNFIEETKIKYEETLEIIKRSKEYFPELIKEYEY